MSQRTTEQQVKDVLLLGTEGGAYNDLTNPSLQPFIDTATSVVDSVLTCASRKGKPLTAAQAELMERWLAAHFYAMTDQTYAEKTTNDAKGVFHGKTGMYLDATKYGQTASGVLDPSGCLLAIDKKKIAGAYWLGKTKTEQIDYVDRN